eukprot:m.984114 g.984114  ORF g.984114 m.984114 type:complete len:1827 (-) comp23975_c0_seq21:225-5705(-)
MPGSSDVKKLSKIERDVAAAERNGNYSRLRELLVRKGNMELNASRPSDAIISFTRASSVGDGENDFSCLRGMGDCCEEMDDFKRALEHRQAHYNLAKKLRNVVEQQRALTCIGNAYYQLAIRKVETNGDAQRESLANSHEMGEALKAHQESKECVERLAVEDVTSDERKRMTATCRYNIGNIYILRQRDKSDLALAKEEFLETARLLRSMKNDSVVLEHDALCEVGNICILEKDFENAVLHLRRATKLASSNQLDQARVVDSANKFGNALRGLGKYDEAKQAIRRAAKLAKFADVQLDEETRLSVIQNYRKARQQVRAIGVINALETKLASTMGSGAKGKIDPDLMHYEESVKHNNLSPLQLDADEIIALYEKLGDKHIVLDKPHAAIKWYSKCVSKMQRVRGEKHPSLAPLYTSLALTLDDTGDAARAAEYYMLELAIHHAADNASKEVAETELRIAQVWMGWHERRAEDLATAAAAINRARDAVDAALSDVDNITTKHPRISASAIESLWSVAAEIETTAHELSVLQGSDTDARRCARRQRALETRRAARSGASHEAGTEADTDASDAGDTSDASNDGSGSDIDFTASEEETAASGMKEGTGPTSTIRKNTGVHNTKNENGETKLQQAVIKGNLQAVRTLLEAGASINCFDNYGWTPLHEACNHGHDDIIQLLLSHPEVRVNDVGQSEVKKMKLTPLHDAAGNGHTGICRMLVEKSADVSLEDYKGQTPILLAAKGEHTDTLAYLTGVANSAGVAVNETALELARMRHELSDYDKDDSDDMILQYNPEHAAVADPAVAVPQSAPGAVAVPDGATRRQRVLQQRQAAKRAAKQLLGDSDESDEDPGNTDDGVGQRPARSRIAFSLADIALTHTRGYRGRLGAPARHGAVADVDASGSENGEALVEARVGRRPLPVGDGNSCRTSVNAAFHVDKDTATARADHEVLAPGSVRHERRGRGARERYAQLAAWESESDSSTSGSGDELPAAAKRYRRTPRDGVSMAIHASSPTGEALDASNHSEPHTQRARVRTHAGVVTHPPAKRTKSMRTKHRSESSHVRETKATQRHGGKVPSTSTSGGTSGRVEVSDFIVHDSASDGMDVDDVTPTSPISPTSEHGASVVTYEATVHGNSDAADESPPRAVLPLARIDVPALSTHSAVVATDDDGYFAVIDVRIADHVGHVRLTRIDRDTTGGQLQRAIVAAYNSAYGMEPTIQRLVNATGETIRLEDRLRHRLVRPQRDGTHPPTVVVVVQAWTDARTLGERLGILLPWTTQASSSGSVEDSATQALRRVATALTSVTGETHVETVDESDSPRHANDDAACVDLDGVGLHGYAVTVFARLLTHAMWIRILRLSDNVLDDTAATQLAHVLPVLPNLTALHLAGNALTATGVRQLWSARAVLTAGRMPLAALTTLDLSFNRLGGLLPSDIAKLLDRSPDLTTLRMEHSDVCLRDVAGALTRSAAQRFERLCLGGNTLLGIDSTTVTALARAARRLNLTDTRVQGGFQSTHGGRGSTGMYQPAPGGGAQKDLCLILRGCAGAHAVLCPPLHVAPTETRALASVETLAVLHTLDVSYSGMTGADAVRLLTALALNGCPRLTSLHVGGTPLGVAGCAALGALIAATPTLTAVNASECALTVDAVTPLLDVLAVGREGCDRAPSLTVLHLHHNNFARTNAATLASLLARITCLEYVDLSGSDFGPGQQQLVHSWTQAMPGRTCVVQSAQRFVLGVALPGCLEGGTSVPARGTAASTRTQVDVAVAKTTARVPGRASEPPTGTSHMPARAIGTSGALLSSGAKLQPKPTSAGAYTAEELVQGLEDVWSDDD